MKGKQNRTSRGGGGGEGRGGVGRVGGIQHIETKFGVSFANDVIGALRGMVHPIKTPRKQTSLSAELEGVGRGGIDRGGRGGVSISRHQFTRISQTTSSMLQENYNGCARQKCKQLLTSLGVRTKAGGM